MYWKREQAEMKAVILAAGVGKRLKAVAQGQPKCLCQVAGHTLLSRYLEDFANLGISHVVIVVGYQHHLIREAAESQQFPGDIRFVFNDAYERGSIGSLWAARHEWNDHLVVMDADVLYHPAILRRLVESPHPTALLMDETIQQTSEECMVVIQHDRVIALTKQVPPAYDQMGEGVGFLKVHANDLPHLLASLEGCLQRGKFDMEYEDALKDFFQAVPVGVERIGGLPWVEIDFPEDIQRAEREMISHLPSSRTEASVGLPTLSPS